MDSDMFKGEDVRLSVIADKQLINDLTNKPPVRTHSSGESGRKQRGK